LFQRLPRSASSSCDRRPNQGCSSMTTETFTGSPRAQIV
jgi:hypothetical protein